MWANILTNTNYTNDICFKFVFYTFVSYSVRPPDLFFLLLIEYILFFCRNSMKEESNLAHSKLMGNNTLVRSIIICTIRYTKICVGLRHYLWFRGIYTYIIITLNLEKFHKTKYISGPLHQHTFSTSCFFLYQEVSGLRSK